MRIIRNKTNTSRNFPSNKRTRRSNWNKIDGNLSSKKPAWGKTQLLCSLRFLLCSSTDHRIVLSKEPSEGQQIWTLLPEPGQNTSLDKDRNSYGRRRGFRLECPSAGAPSRWREGRVRLRSGLFQTQRCSWSICRRYGNESYNTSLPLFRRHLLDEDGERSGETRGAISARLASHVPTYLHFLLLLRTQFPAEKKMQRYWVREGEGEEGETWSCQPCPLINLKTPTVQHLCLSITARSSSQIWCTGNLRGLQLAEASDSLSFDISYFHALWKIAARRSFRSPNAEQNRS